MLTQDTIDEVLAAKQVRLTPRAKQLLQLIFDGLMNEPFHCEAHRGPALTPEASYQRRIKFFHQEMEGLPGKLGELAYQNRTLEPDEDGFQFLTLFDILYNFKSSIADRATMFFPGSI